MEEKTIKTNKRIQKIINKRFEEMQNKGNYKELLNFYMEDKYYGRIKDIMQILYEQKEDKKKQLLNVWNEEKRIDFDIEEQCSKIETLIDRLQMYVMKGSYEENDFIGLSYSEMTDSFYITKRLQILLELDHFENVVEATIPNNIENMTNKIMSDNICENEEEIEM